MSGRAFTSDTHRPVVGSNPTKSSCRALVPRVYSGLPRNREQPGATYGSLALKVLCFVVGKHGDRLAILPFNIYKYLQTYTLLEGNV